MKSVISNTNNKDFLTNTLKFKNKDEERNYNSFIEDFQLLYQKIFLAGALLMSIFNWAIFPYPSAEKNDARSAALSAINIAILASAMLSTFFRKIRRLPITFWNIYVIVLIVEPSNQLDASEQTKMSSLLALEIELLLLVPLVSRCNWMNSSLSTLGISLYLLLRFFKNIDSGLLNGLVVIVVSMNIIFIAISSFLTEKFNRHIFHQSFEDQNQLRRYQHLVKRILPNSMLVFSKQKVAFYNHELCRLLHVNYKTKIEERLSQITIKSKADKQEKAPNFSEKLVPNTSLCLESSLDLHQFLLSDLKQGQFDCGFESFTGALQLQAPASQEGQAESKILDIKICSLDWEGAEGLLLIISEDQESEQARYKDKLLATVSHDLRTPLNGIIGILDMSIEASHDAQLRKRYR